MNQKTLEIITDILSFCSDFSNNTSFDWVNMDSSIKQNLHIKQINSAILFVCAYRLISLIFELLNNILKMFYLIYTAKPIIN